MNFPKYAGPLYLQNTFGRMRLHLEPCQISIVEIFCGNSKLFTVFEKKTNHYSIYAEGGSNHALLAVSFHGDLFHAL